jgi:hypothetical protein
MPSPAFQNDLDDYERDQDTMLGDGGGEAI